MATIYSYPYLLSGQGPINGYSASYKTTEQDGLAISTVVSTLMGGPKVLEDYEKNYFYGLSNAKNFEISNNLLTINYDNGSKLMFVAIED
jgi:heat shock protein HslJ